MKAVLQRVTEASVRVDGEVIGSIGKGFFILLGVSDEDDEAVADKMADKICKLRIFEDENGKTSSPCMQTAGRETVPASSERERRQRQTGFMNISWTGAGPMWIGWSMEDSAQI